MGRASTRFWHDNWSRGDTLKKIFPRLFLISTQQNDFIGDMGLWENNKWVWKFMWRRRLFAWEEELVESLYLAVDHTSLNESYPLERDREQPGWSWKTSMEESCPPRAQLLVWFILQGRLNTKERLFRFGLPEIEDNLCVFCKEEPETVDHVIFGCRCSSRLWYFCCSCSNLSLCLPHLDGCSFHQIW